MHEGVKVRQIDLTSEGLLELIAGSLSSTLPEQKVYITRDAFKLMLHQKERVLSFLDTTRSQTALDTFWIVVNGVPKAKTREQYLAYIDSLDCSKPQYMGTIFGRELYLFNLMFALGS